MARIQIPSPPNPPRGSTRVIIHVSGPVAVVEPALADLLVPHLTSERRTFGGDGGRIATRTVPEAHGQVVDGRLMIPAGLVPRIATILGRHGRAVLIVDETTARPRVAI